MKTALLIACMWTGLAMCGCVPRIPEGPPLYRLVDCTLSGVTALSKATRGHLSSVGTSHTDGEPTKYYVSKSEWNMAKQILDKIMKSHPKDFSNEAARPEELFHQASF